MSADLINTQDTKPLYNDGRHTAVSIPYCYVYEDVPPTNVIRTLKIAVTKAIITGSLFIPAEPKMPKTKAELGWYRQHGKRWER